MTTQHDPDAARLGPRVENWTPPPHPKGITLDGRHCRLVPLSADDHGADLFAANAKDTAASGWDYLPYGPFAQVDEYKDWIKTSASGDDPCFFAVEHKGLQCWAGVASYLRKVFSGKPPWPKAAIAIRHGLPSSTVIGRRYVRAMKLGLMMGISTLKAVRSSRFQR